MFHTHHKEKLYDWEEVFYFFPLFCQLIFYTNTLTAIGNDYSYERVFARQLEAKAKEGDILIGIVFSEMLRKWSAKFNYHPNQVIDLFAFIGYQCFVIENNKLKPFGLVDEETIETNYFFLHKEKHMELIQSLVCGIGI